MGLRELFNPHAISDRAWRENRLLADSTRSMRTLLMVGMVALYVWTMTLESSNFLTAPVAHAARSMFFPTPESNLEDIVQQEFTKSLGEMMATSTIASFLYTMQFKCREQAFQDGALAMDFMTCDLEEVEFSDPLPNQAFPSLPCLDLDFLGEISGAGDLVDYDKRPTVLEAIYDANGTPEEDRVPVAFPIHQSFPLYAPFFNSDGDKERGMMGPLPTLSHKLDLLAKKSGVSDPIFDQDPWNFAQASAAVRGPPQEGATNVERNHHWDILLRCEPKSLKVTFKVRTIESASVLPLYWNISFGFDRHMQGLAVYKASLDINASHFYHVNRTWELIAPLGTFLCMALLLVVPAGSALVYLGPSTARILLKKGSFKRLVYQFFDPLGYRVNYMPLYEVVEEDLGFLFSLLGFITSAVYLFVPSEAFAVAGEATSPMSYWLQSDLSAIQVATQTTFALFSSGILHCIALTFYILRIIEFSVLFAGTNYIVLTFFFVFFPIVHFMSVFMLILFAFALMAHTLFGNIFIQYASLGKSVKAMLLYSFGFGDFVGVTSGINPQIEDKAFQLTVLHLVFTILLVVIMLNIFTSIVVDAYQVALDRCTSPSKLVRLEAAMWYRLKVAFGFYDELQPEIDILGGRPGHLFFRSNIPRESPLNVNLAETEPSTDVLIGKLREAVENLEKAQPILMQLQSAEDAPLGGHSERGRETSSDPSETAGLLQV